MRGWDGCDVVALTAWVGRHIPRTIRFHTFMLGKRFWAVQKPLGEWIRSKKGTPVVSRLGKPPQWRQDYLFALDLRGFFPAANGIFSGSSAQHQYMGWAG